MLFENKPSGNLQEEGGKKWSGVREQDSEIYAQDLLNAC